MALQGSGPISLNNIKTEFGGVDSHSLSEYYPLEGMGVTGIPPSGPISFSDFYAKSKDVVTSVWTPSGYNTSSWVRIQTRNSNGMANGGYGHYRTNGDDHNVGYYSGTAYGGPETNGYNTNPNSSYNNIFYSGNYRFMRGAYDSAASGNKNWHYGLNIDEYQTTWVDTSGYVDTPSIASIST